MKLIYKTGTCALIEFNEKTIDLRKQGWLGDEAEARVFVTDDGITEIRIFKRDGESYVLAPDSKNAMDRMKARKILNFIDRNA